MVDPRIVYPTHHPYRDKLERAPAYGEEILEEARLKMGYASSPEALSALKIVLQYADLPITDGNLGLAADWVRNFEAEVMSINEWSPSEKRKHRKELRRFVLRGAKANEIGFINRVKLENLEAKHSGDTIFDGVLNHVKGLKGETLDNTYPHAQEDITEIARRFTADGVKFERPQGTSLHHFLDDLHASTYGHEHNEKVLSFFRNEFQSFVIEHDWAKAFEGVKDFDGGEIKLPYAFTCFEFRFNGVRVLVFLGESTNGTIEGIVASGINKRWYINPMRVTFDGTLKHPDYHESDFDKYIIHYLKMLGSQIRAVCIMLDANVAVGERRSLAGEALRQKREREGKAPLRDYHVVALAKRLHQHHESGEPTGIKKRLHWRRGHWRHFQTPGGEVRYINEEGITVSKTWVKWHLAGNENLGFVEKHYKL